MDYLRIDQDVGMLCIRGKDPEDNSELLGEIADGDVQVLRYRGNRFEFLDVDREESEDEGGEADFSCTWTAVPE